VNQPSDVTGPVEVDAPVEDLELVQVLDIDGVPVAPVPGLDPDRLRRLYELMVLTRELDTEFVHLQRQGQLALYPSCRGQEGAQVGATAALRDRDWLFPQYRELGAFVTRGVDPAGVGAAWRGNRHGGRGFVERSCAPMSIPIGTHALHAVGAAMAAQRLGEDSVTVAFVGDGATSTGDVHEALNFAAVFEAPCVFLVQNNHWAISVPLTGQLRARSIAHKAIGYGMPGVRVDGNDVLACWAVMTEAAARARSGRGPTLIEAVTYRIGPHTTSDDPNRYRDPDEVAQWAARDPVSRLRRYLERCRLWSTAADDQLAEDVRRARRSLRAAVVDVPDPPPGDLFDHVFADPPPDLRRQRRQLTDEWERRTRG